MGTQTTKPEGTGANEFLPTPSAEIVPNSQRQAQIWEAIAETNAGLRGVASEAAETAKHLLSTRAELRCAWNRIGWLWVFSSGGWLMGATGIILAVTR